MYSVSFDRATPLGARFVLVSGSDRWTVTVLNEALIILTGDDAEARFRMNRDRLMNIAVAKVAIGETFQGHIFISLGDMNRPDLAT